MKRRLLNFAVLLALGAATNVAVAWFFSAGLPTGFPGQQPADREAPVHDEPWGSHWWVQVTSVPGATDVIWEPTIVRRRQLTNRREITSRSHLYRKWRDREETVFLKEWAAAGETQAPLLSGLRARWNSDRGAAYVALLDKLSAGPPPLELATLPRWARHPKAFPYTPSNFACRVFSARGWPLVSLKYEAVLDGSSSASDLTTVAGGLRLPWRANQLELGVVFPYRVIPGAFAADTAFYVVVIWVLAGGAHAVRRWIRTRRGLCPYCAYPIGESPVCTECGAELSAPARAA
jgi:hypothetical protein